MIFTAALLVSLSFHGSGQDDLVITNVTVIDVVSGTRVEARAVRISGDRIESIQQTADFEPGADERVVDGTGAFLIPGLWDMHAELVAHHERDLPLLVANGITGVRNMLGDPGETLEDVVALRDAIEAGRRLGPRIVANAALLGPAEPGRPLVSSPQDAAAARIAVRRMPPAGADFLEIRGSLSREVFFAITDEAAGLKLPTAGLVPWQVTAVEASEAGQSCFEAMFKLLVGCCDQEPKVTARYIDYYRAREGDDPEASRFWAFFLEGLDSTYDPARREGLIATLRRNRTWQCPLLRLNRFHADPDALAFQDDETHAYVPVQMRRTWKDKQFAVRAAVAATNPADNQRHFRLQQDLVRDMQRAGIGILAGSGLGRPYVVAGFGLHAELAMLVDAGLTPAEALRAATLAPATYLGREAQLGTVATGKRADLVLLAADPLADIANTRAIRAVVVRGRLLEREDLDGLLSQARRLADR